MQWKDVVGFEEYFRISEFGDLWSKRSNRVLKFHLHVNGYKVVSTKIGGRKGKNYCFKLHRLVATAFLASPTEEVKSACSDYSHGEVIVRHLDNDKQNNHFSNLAWGTSKDNYEDWRDSKGYLAAIQKQSGHRKCNASLNEDQVSDIRIRYTPRCPVNGGRALALEYGVVHSVISRVVNNFTYK